MKSSNILNVNIIKSIFRGIFIQKNSDTEIIFTL